MATSAVDVHDAMFVALKMPDLYHVHAHHLTVPVYIAFTWDRFLCTRLQTAASEPSFPREVGVDVRIHNRAARHTSQSNE